jgi:hypothetical protein
MWGVIVTIIGLPREVAMAALLGFIVLSRYVLEGVDDRPRHWRSTDLSR